MNHNERTHIPTVKQCAQCRHWSANCDSIAFERMPVAKTNPDGKRLVYCACFQPAPLAQALNNLRQADTPPQAALSENPLIIAFRHIMLAMQHPGARVCFKIKGAPGQTSSLVDQAVSTADQQLGLRFEYLHLTITGERVLTLAFLNSKAPSMRRCIWKGLEALGEQAKHANEPRIAKLARLLAHYTSPTSVKTTDPTEPIGELKEFADELGIGKLYRFGERGVSYIDDAPPAAAPEPKAEDKWKLFKAIASRAEESAAPADPYAHLKAAEAAGKKVQFLCDANVWVDENPIAPGWQYSFPPERYRVAPETPPNLDVGTHTHPRVPATLSPTTTSEVEVDVEAWLADRAARAAAPAKKKDAAPFTSQPEVKALALIVAALRDGTGNEHGLVVDENTEYVRMVQMMIPLCNVIAGMTIRERLGMDRPDMADAFRQDQVTSATISASYRAPTPDQEPVTRRIGSLLSEFIRLYPHTPLSLSAEEVTALAHLRDFFSGRNSDNETQEPKSVWRAAMQWERALGICDMLKTYPDLLKPIKVTIPPTEDEQRAQAHRAIADALTNPGADIKLPGHDVTADAVLAKMVNDILRQTQTKGYTFHTAEGAFVRCGE